jgi:hypothetical protein
MDPNQPNLAQMFGEQAPLVQQVLQGALQQATADLHQQIANLQQQIAAQQAPPANHAPGAAPTQRDPKVAEPPFFTGNRSEAAGWVLAVRLHITLTPTMFPPNDENRKILFALAYIRGGDFSEKWANNHKNAFLNPTAPNPFQTLEEFFTAFEIAFRDHNRNEAARHQMEALRIKPGETVEAYTTAFESLQTDTEYNDISLVEKYRRGLPRPIVEKIYSSADGTLPVNLAGWKLKARQLDNLYRDFKDLGYGTPAQTNKPKAPNTGGRALSAPPAASTGAASSSDAMDVDGHTRKGDTRRCYNCNKPGHIARNCPEPRKARSIRGFTIDELAETIKCLLQGEKSGEDFLESQA